MEAAEPPVPPPSTVVAVKEAEEVTVKPVAAPPAPAQPEPAAPEPPAASVADEPTPVPLPPATGLCPEAPVVVKAETAVVPVSPWACFAEVTKKVMWRIACMPVD